MEQVYVSDPINAVRIFNEKEADELIVLDIDDIVQPFFVLIAKLAAESPMPLCYGGWVSNSEQAACLAETGVGTIVVSAAAIAYPSLLTEMATAVGR